MKMKTNIVELSKAIEQISLDPQEVENFKQNPKEVLAKYGMQVPPDANINITEPTRDIHVCVSACVGVGVSVGN
jgi:hypothetical protein